MQAGTDGDMLFNLTETTQAFDSSGETLTLPKTYAKLEIVNKGPNTLYFRLDGTTPTAGAGGNADVLPANARVLISQGYVLTVGGICNAAETATALVRGYN